MDDELFVDLHTLSATCISVCRLAVLQQAVKTLGISMHQTTAYDDDCNKVMCTVELKVPPHIQMPRLEEKKFHGDWVLTSDAAVQSACSAALVYLQKANMLIIDGVHSDELKNCKRKLLEASSWADAFEQRATKLQADLADVLHKTNSVQQNASLTTELSDGIEHSKERHAHAMDALQPFSTIPSVVKPVNQRARSALLHSKVRRPLFNDREVKEREPPLGDGVLVKDTLISSEFTGGHSPQSEESVL